MSRFQERKWSGEKGKKFGRVTDPYLPTEGQEAAVCTGCQALYQNKRWFFDDQLYRRLAGTDKVKEVICPTCRKIKEQYPEGILTLKGDFFQQHREEIMALVEKEAARIAAKSVQDRLIRIIPGGKDRLVVETTSEKLAQHLGRTVYRAFKGDLDFRWSEMNKFVRVYWSR